MDSSLVQQHLGRYLFDKQHTAICGNFQTRTLPECDLISVNKEGLLCEWEIKISRSDFQADFRKEEKHKNLAAGRGHLIVRGGKQNLARFLTCSYFSYACPAGLLGVGDLPAYAGLVWVYPDGRIDIKRAAPVRHQYPADAYILSRITHNLTQKYLYGCSRSTFMQHRAQGLPTEGPADWVYETPTPPAPEPEPIVPVKITPRPAPKPVPVETPKGRLIRPRGTRFGRY